MGFHLFRLFSLFRIASEMYGIATHERLFLSLFNDID
jgi:hypothetical protein